MSPFQLAEHLSTGGGGDKLREQPLGMLFPGPWMLRLLGRKSLFVVGAVRPLRTAPELADPACVVSAHLKRVVRSPFRLGSKNIWVSGRHPAPPRRGGCPSEPRAADIGAPPPCLGLQGVRFGEQGEIKQLVFEIT